MTNTKVLLAALALSSAVIVGAVVPASAGADVNTATGLVLANGKPAPGLAVHGYDVVAYHTAGKPVRGDAKFAIVHNEATYRFASEDNLNAFKANPAKYEPAYGGYCAFGVSVGAKFDGDPNYWKIVDGKLYLNLDNGIQQKWLSDVPAAIKKADATWPSIKDKLPSEIK